LQKGEEMAAKKKDKKKTKKDNKKDKKKDKTKKKNKDKTKKKDKDKTKTKKDKKKPGRPKKTEKENKSNKKDKEKKKPKTYNIADICDKAEVNERDVKAFVDTLRRRLERMKVGSKVRFPGICNFVKVETNPRVSRNPRTGEKVDVPAKKKIRVTISSKMKDL
jgi:nucleoid DNA-binding protein